MKTCYGITVECTSNPQPAVYAIQRGIDREPLHLCGECCLAMVRAECRANAHQRLNDIAGSRRIDLGSTGGTDA